MIQYIFKLNDNVHTQAGLNKKRNATQYVVFLTFWT